MKAKVRMNKVLIGAALLALLGASPALAENPAQVRQLLTTRICPGCDLRGANLSGANLSSANLQGADLRRANLRDAYLAAVDIAGRERSPTNLRRANLTGANLTGANLSDANLTGANLTGARYCLTTIPNGSIRTNPALAAQAAIRDC
jgi:uncharacterized protein YjbI with pentapeptide repeats